MYAETMVQNEPLLDLKQTGAKMRWLADNFCEDMARYSSDSWLQIFDRIKALPYIPDAPLIEQVHRPFYTMNKYGVASDCDDRAICVGAFATLRGEPYEFWAVGRFPDKPLHHVLTKVYIDGVPTIVDPTYGTNIFGKTPCDIVKSERIG